ncbi:MAG: nucleoside hydrolase [Gemmataceae bacterium]
MRSLPVVVLARLFLASTQAHAADEAKKVPIILDLDIGTDIDDTFALAFALHCPEIELVGVTSVSGDTLARAKMCCRMLVAAGRKDIPVAVGGPPQPPQDLRGEQIQYVRHAAVIFNRAGKPIKEDAVTFMYNKLKERKGEITLVSVGPMTNIATLLTKHPDCKPWIKRIVSMGGSVRVGYNNKAPISPEFNIRCDPKSAKVVFESGVPFTIAPLDATTMLKLNKEQLDKIFRSNSNLNLQVENLFQLWNQTYPPTMYDPVAVTLAFTEKFCKMEDLHIEVDDKGFTREGKGKPNVRAATSIDADAWRAWFVDRFAADKGNHQPQKDTLKNHSKLVERGGLPNRVHAFEDFETDIEKRWWMSGKAETKNVAHGKRSGRSVLTQDFDDLQGNMKTMWQGIVFNPVPGPPMGKNPRLSFRYFLNGTDTMRVAVYSLSKGYHRNLLLTGLPQGKWLEGTVDMTQIRRPDGTGGPLAEDERIDDIQFYTDPGTELLIDDIVLYDAAPEGEKRPYPRSILYTGVFDTGKQGKEWPGDFEIVPHEKPLTWKAAKSIDSKEVGSPWIRLSLRGPRPAGDKTHLRFRYKLTGADTLKAELNNKTQNKLHTVNLTGLKQGEWAEAYVDFAKAETSPKKGDGIDEIRLIVPTGATLLIDDVLLFEPGE